MRIFLRIMIWVGLTAGIASAGLIIITLIAGAMYS